MTEKHICESKVAIIAALPIFENALSGDLDKSVALEWIKDILLKGLKETS